VTYFSDAGWSPDMHGSMWMARAEARILHAEMFSGVEMTITSGMRKQSPGGSSLHPLGRAFDVRVRAPDGSWEMTAAEQWAFAAELAKRLGEDFDVVIEGPAATNPAYKSRVPHVHIEFDPKGRHAQRLVDQ
jgi:hypothetical protein